jgi:2-keto-4-pentenoate hydratase/2-oxohepta-3-ene-1,7-dioic acid hydratase in catechol pathway
MRLVTFESPSGERRAGALAGAGRVVDLAVASAALLDADGAGHPLPADMLALLEQEDGIETARAALDHGRATGAGMVDLAQVRLLSPLPRPRSLRDFMLVEQHVLGSFAEVPAEWHAIPVYWKGNADAVLGPDEAIRWPVYTRQLDFELEMAAVIGRRAEAVDVEEAWSCIAGYTIFNDWSARD